MKILVVAENININHSSGAKANVAMIDNLVSAGYIVDCVHYSGKKVQIKNVNSILVTGSKVSMLFVLSRLISKIQLIFNININKYIESIFGFSITHYFDVKVLKKYLEKINIADYNIIITLSYAASFRTHKAVLEIPSLHSKWLAYIHDPYPMACYPRPYDWVENGHNLKFKFMYDVLNSCKMIGFPSLWLAKWMSTYFFNRDLEKCLIIPHQNNYLNHESVSVNESDLKFNKNEFTLLHAGSLMDARNPLPLVNSFIRFIENLTVTRKNKCKLVFVGHESSYHEELRKLAAIYPQIIVHDGYLEFSQTINLQNTASANIILEADAPFSPFLPGKFANCVESNRPIFYLGPVVSETSRLLGDNYPYLSEILDQEKIFNNIVLLYNNWNLNNNNLNLNRPDLLYYLSIDNLKKTIINFKSNA
jgi:hypothetical protein